MTEQRDQRGLSRAFIAVTRMLGVPDRDGDVPGQRDGGNTSAIVDCGLYLDGERQPGEWHYAEALHTARRKGPHAFVWLGLHEPGAAELAEIASVFDLHELPVEDAVNRHQRPKIERYNDMVFAVVRTTRYVQHRELTEYSEVVETGAVMMFIGEHFVITVRHGAGAGLGAVRAELESKPELLRAGAVVGRARGVRPGRRLLRRVRCRGRGGHRPDRGDRLRPPDTQLAG